MDNFREKINEYRASFCPFGELDIKCAIRIAEEVGEDIDWAVDCVDQLVEEYGLPYNQIDCVYAVYSQIEQEARTDIENITGFDICNDCKGHMAVYGNYLVTSFDYNDKFREWLISILKGKELDEFNKFTQFFLSELDIDNDNLKTEDDETDN